MKKYIISALLIISFTSIMAQVDTNTTSPQAPQSKPVIIDTTATGPKVKLHTSEGDVTIRLYDDTPAHRDNFMKLAQSGAYDGVLFHRVINDFMVQTGDLNSKNPDNKIPLGAGDNGYTLPAEIDYPHHFHKYGALAAARTSDEVNPERRSSGSQFYIVTGNVYSPRTLERFVENQEYQEKQAYFQRLVRDNWDKIQQMQAASDTVGLDALQKVLIDQTEKAVKIPPMPQNVIEAYTTIGGTPHLDGAYTVFGEVLDGMNVVEKIQKTPVDRSDNPITPIVINKVTILEQ